MRNFEAIRNAIQKNKDISAKTIDEYLIYYVASRHGVEKIMNKRFAAYKHITKEFPQEWINRLKAQYLAHLIFKTDGYIHSILKESVLGKFNTEEIEFLRQWANHPWRFSFSVITGNPESDFYDMRDVFTGDRFALFSPGITNINSEQHTSLWFNLIGFNGECWETYGPIAAYKSFEPDDIFFFACLNNLKISDWEELMPDVENNPIPYMMLLSGANYPLTFHKKDQLVNCISEYDLESINTVDLKKSFKSEYYHDVYRFSLKHWSEYPHYAHAFYDEKERIILFTAQTDRGFKKLTDTLNQHHGYSFSEEPFSRVNMAMLITAKNILEQELILNEYEELFAEDIKEEESEELSKINAFMALILPDINAGLRPDIKTHARTAGIELDVAQDLVNHVMDQFGKMGK